MYKSLCLPQALNMREQGGSSGLEMLLPFGTAQSTPTAARAGRTCTPPQPPMAAGADKRGWSPAPAAQDAAGRSSDAHVAKCFLSSFCVCLFSVSPWLCKKGPLISAGLWSGLPWKEARNGFCCPACRSRAGKESRAGEFS